VPSALKERHVPAGLLTTLTAVKQDSHSTPRLHQRALSPTPEKQTPGLLPLGVFRRNGRDNCSLSFDQAVVLSIPIYFLAQAHLAILPQPGSRYLYLASMVP